MVEGKKDDDREDAEMETTSETDAVCC